MNSKRVHFLALALTLSVLAGCTREQDPVLEQVPVMTIRASLPEEPVTRAGFSVPESGPGLHLEGRRLHPRDQRRRLRRL